MAQAFPASRFTGYDFSEGAIRAARGEAERLGLANASFEVVDVAGLDVEARFDAVTAFDGIHDQAHPAAVLRNIHRALRPGGTFLMVDIKASSNVEENIELPWGSDARRRRLRERGVQGHRIGSVQRLLHRRKVTRCRHTYIR